MKQYFVDSRDRVSGTSSNFSVMLPATLSLDSGHQGRIDDLRLPITVPTISYGNNTIQVRMGSQDYTVTIPTGQFFTGHELAGELRSLLQRDVPGTWTVVFDSRNTSMGFACTNPFTFTGGSWMSKLLARPHDYNGSGYLFYYCPLQGVDVVYLTCQNFSSHENSVGPKGAADCLCSIPITSAYGSVQAYSMSTSVFFDIPALTTQQLSFQLRDRDFNILHDVPNISFVLTID